MKKKTREPQLSAVVPDMEQLYRTMVEKETAGRTLAGPPDASWNTIFQKEVFYGTEGKDRCGLLSALLLSALGVNRGTILEDYLLTNEVNGPKSDMFYQKLLASGRTEAEAGAVRDVFLQKRNI